MWGFFRCERCPISQRAADGVCMCGELIEHHFHAASCMHHYLTVAASQTLASITQASAAYSAWVAALNPLAIAVHVGPASSANLVLTY